MTHEGKFRWHIVTTSLTEEKWKELQACHCESKRNDPAATDAAGQSIIRKLRISRAQLDGAARNGLVFASDGGMGGCDARTDGAGESGVPGGLVTTAPWPLKYQASMLLRAFDIELRCSSDIRATRHMGQVELVLAGQTSHHLAVFIRTQADRAGGKTIAVPLDVVRVLRCKIVFAFVGIAMEALDNRAVDTPHATPVTTLGLAKEAVALDETLADGHEETQKERDCDAQDDGHVGGEWHEAIGASCGHLCAKSSSVILHIRVGNNIANVLYRIA
eukprot:scaffold903_cov40-Prasinocladus_malaysianus.AAC.1